MRLLFKLFNYFAMALGYFAIGSFLYVTTPEITRRVFVPAPKFKVGDCIRSFDSFDSIIIEIIPPRGLQVGMYGHTVGLNCHDAPHYFDCSTTVGDTDIVDNSSVKIECPKQ